MAHVEIPLPDGSTQPFDNVPDGTDPASLMAAAYAQHGFSLPAAAKNTTSTPGDPGLMDPNYQPPNPGMDALKSIRPGVGAGVAGLVDFFNRIPEEIKYLYQKATKGEVSPDLKADLLSDDNIQAKIASVIGGDYVPKTPAGDFTKSTVAGATGATLLPGRSLANTLMGAAGGAAGNTAGQVGLGPMGESLAAMTPQAIAAALNGVRPGAPYSMARQALKELNPEQRAKIQYLQDQAAQQPNPLRTTPGEMAFGNPQMPTLPQSSDTGQTALGNLWSAAARSPGKNSVQDLLRSRFDNNVIPNMGGPMTPLGEALDNADALRGANSKVSPSFKGQAGVHLGATSVGLGALGHEDLEEALGNPVFMKMPLYKHAYDLASRSSLTDLMNQSSLEDLTKAAQYNPNKAALVHAMRGVMQAHAAGFPIDDPGGDQ